MMLYQIQEAVRLRTEAITAAHPNWPCRKGCDDCCRHLASTPAVTAPEWEAIARALNALPHPVAEAARNRIRAAAARPIVCPLLDTASGTCLIYDARPVACRAYGFYAERQYVLGCNRIEAIAEESREVIWGNHTALEEQLRSLGLGRLLPDWLA